MSKDNFQVGRRVVVIADPENWLAGWGVKIGDVGTICRPTLSAELSVRVSFDEKRIPRHQQLDPAIGLGTWKHSIRLLDHSYQSGCKHRAKLAWQRGDYATL